MISQQLYKQLVELKLDSPRNMAILEIMYENVDEYGSSRNEYTEKEAFRVHSLNDHNKICKTCNGGVVVPLHGHSNFLGLCLQTNKFVCGNERYYNEWSEWYFIYIHIISIDMLKTAMQKYHIKDL